jgi:energy-coupling factor transporter ATP-binding protein EcfA2
MRIIKLHLHPFAGTVNKTYDFQSGLNVVYGHNEAGKSTIVKALLMALLTPTKLTVPEFKSQIANFIPIGGDTINIDLTFEADGIEYELKKSWGVHNISSLNKVNEAGINDAEKVQAELFELLKLNKSAIRDVIFTTQAKIASTVEGIAKDKDAEVINSLDQILRGAILNTGGINPEEVKLELTNAFEDLTDNWDLDSDAPIIGKNNKGSYDNKWARDVGDILGLAYEIYDKEVALRGRVEYDQKYTTNTNSINELKVVVNADRAFKNTNLKLEESLTQRKEINNEIKEILDKKKELNIVQTEWNAINASLPTNTNTLNADNQQLINLRTEIGNARLAADSTVKIAQFDRILSLKNSWQNAQLALGEVKVVKDNDVAAVKAIFEPLTNAKAELSSLEAAQKFIVNIHPKSSIVVELQHSAGVSEKTNLTTGNNISIEVNKGFIYSSSEVTIEVKSLTDQINELNTKVEQLHTQNQAELATFGVSSFQELIDLNIKYNTAHQLVYSSKLNYDNALVGTSFEQLEQEVNVIRSLPMTRSVGELDGLINTLLDKIAKLKLTIDNDNENINQFIATYETLDKVDELRIDCIQKERAANNKLSELPPLDDTFNIDEFRSNYLEVKNRLEKNEEILKELELGRANLDGGQPEVLASELQDEIELLQRQKDQKIEEAKAIRKVLIKLNEILGRNPANPYQVYEQNLSQYLNTLSGGKYIVTESSNITPNIIKNATTNLELPVDLLSQGTSGVLGLSLRLAMADYYLEGQNGFLAFDDPMVDFDENRQGLAAQCFQGYAENKQVLIFTCHQSHANMLRGNLINL